MYNFCCQRKKKKFYVNEMEGSWNSLACIVYHSILQLVSTFGCSMHLNRRHSGLVIPAQKVPFNLKSSTKYHKTIGQTEGQLQYQSIVACGRDSNPRPKQQQTSTLTTTLWLNTVGSNAWN